MAAKQAVRKGSRTTKILMISQTTIQTPASKRNPRMAQDQVLTLTLVGFGHIPSSRLLFIFILLGIFFSKDRREEVIEVEETPEYVELGSGLIVPLMTQGEWMKGCPEGGEQGLLFQLYSRLSGETLKCPGGCGHAINTDKALFFATWVGFYNANLIAVPNLVFSAQVPRLCQKSAELDSIRLSTL